MELLMVVMMFADHLIAGVAFILFGQAKTRKEMCMFFTMADSVACRKSLGTYQQLRG